MTSYFTTLTDREREIARRIRRQTILECVAFILMLPFVALFLYALMIAF